MNKNKILNILNYCGLPLFIIIGAVFKIENVLFYAIVFLIFGIFSRILNKKFFIVNFLYWIIGILLGKIISMFFFNIIWKPYYLFSEGFHKSVWEFWHPMSTYYSLFFIFVSISIAIRYLIIDNYINSIQTLIGLGITIIPTLLLFYFLSLFTFTRGMKYFVARKPIAYHHLCKILYIKS